MCILCNESVQRVRPTRRVYSKVTPAASGSKPSGQSIQRVGCVRVRPHGRPARPHRSRSVRRPRHLPQGRRPTWTCAQPPLSQVGADSQASTRVRLPSWASALRWCPPCGWPDGRPVARWSPRSSAPQPQPRRGVPDGVPVKSTIWKWPIGLSSDRRQHPDPRGSPTSPDRCHRGRREGQG